MATSTAQAIATVPVYDYLLPPGDPTNTNPKGLKGKRVTVTLTYSLAQSAAPVTLLGTDPVVATTDDNGFWQVNLVPNNKISPGGTIYKVEIEGYRSYVIQPTDVGVPVIGWQSSAIATLPPIGGGAPGYTLPGGTTVLGEFTATDYVSTGIVGAANQTRWVGATPFGAPTAGTFQIGDWVISKATGNIFICTVAGTPGTWTSSNGIFNTKDYGAKVDGQFVTDGVMTLGSPTILTSATGKFALTDVGKSIAVGGAGAAGAILQTTIASWQSATQVTLTVGATTAVAAATAVWATLDTNAILAAIAAAGIGRSGVGARVYQPQGISGINGTLITSDQIRNIIFEGAGMGTSWLVPLGLGGNAVFNVGSASMGQITLQNFSIGNLSEPGAVIAGQHAISNPQNQRTVAVRAVEIQFMGADAVNHAGNSSLWRMQDCWVHDNYRGWGFNGTGATAALQNIVVDGNSFYANGGGVRINSSFGCTVSNNDIEGGGLLLPSNPMMSITGNSVWCYNNTCGLVNGSTAADCVFINATNIVWEGGSANVNSANKTCMHLGPLASRCTLQNPSVNGSNLANQTGILLDVGGFDNVVSGPVYGTGAGALTANLTDNATRTELADTLVQYPGTDGYYHFGNASTGIVNSAGDLEVRSKAGNKIYFRDANAVIQGWWDTVDRTLHFGAAASQIVPGATSMSLRNAANTADNLLVTDAGNATARGYLNTLGGYVYIGAFNLATGRIVGGSASTSVRNNADTADNLLITDAGDATFRGGFKVDAAGHLVSTSAGTPATSNLGVNVTSVTFTGNDVRGTIAIVMSGGLAANTRVCTATFATSYGATPPKITLVDQTSTAGLAIVNSYVLAQATGVSFDLAFDQALVAGTYTIDYIVIG